MEYYTREQQGLAPPRNAYPTNCAKSLIVIHHTSSPNGEHNLQKDFAYNRMVQQYHEAHWGSPDIMQAYTNMQSGRVLEGRRPVTSNNGAAYGTASAGVGIENEGTFTGSVLMQPKQYAALVELCVYVCKTAPCPPVFFGHRQLTNYDPRNADTDCPGNLIAQFGLGSPTGRLAIDVKAALAGYPLPQPKEEKDMSRGLRVTEMPKQGNLHVWVIAEGYNSLGFMKKLVGPWLVIYNESKDPATIQLWTNPGGQIPQDKIPNGGLIKGWSRFDMDVGGFNLGRGVKGGFSTVIKSKSNNLAIDMSVFEWPTD